MKNWHYGAIIAGVIILILVLSAIGFAIWYEVDSNEKEAEKIRLADEKKRKEQQLELDRLAAINKQKELDRLAAISKQNATNQQRSLDLQKAREQQRIIDLQKAKELERLAAIEREKLLQVAIAIKNEQAQQREVAIQREVEQQNAGLPSYTFYPNVESREGNIMKIRDADVPTLQDWCSTRSDCLGFNTSGYVKNVIAPMSDWWTFTEDSSQGLYVKDIKPVNDGVYTFYPHMDSETPNYANFLPNTDPTRFKVWCNELPNCKGFNTKAGLKNIIAPKASWVNWSNNPLDGLYVKNTTVLT